MKNISLFFLLILIFYGCSSSRKPSGEVPLNALPEKMAFSKGLYFSDYWRFRLKGNSFNIPFHTKNKSFSLALSNEFFSYDSKEKGLSNAIQIYKNLVEEVPEEIGFFLQRLGVCYYKLKEYSKSWSYLGLAIVAGMNNSEVFYYRSLLSFYYRRNYREALYYIDLIKNEKVFLDQQDIKVMEASIWAEQNQYEKAYSLYMNARDINRKRFYLSYNLIPFFIESNFRAQGERYIHDAFNVLASLSNSNARKKAYEQLIFYNSFMGKETLSFSFVEGSSGPYPDLIYYHKFSGVINKRKSQNLAISLKEKKGSSKDKIYYPLYEDYYDDENKSEIFLVEGVGVITNVRISGRKEITPIVRVVMLSNTLLLLSPTNMIQVVTNTDRSTNSKDYIVTNYNSELFITNSGINYYIGTESFDLDNNNIWDYIVFGVSSTNQGAIGIFYPDTRRLELVNFYVKTSQCRIIVQDIDNDGKNEILLMDDDVYILKDPD